MSGDNDIEKPEWKREELRVGLERHAVPHSTTAPRWFVDFGGWIFGGILLVGVLGTFLVVSRQDESGVQEASASLVVMGSPKKVWDEGVVSTLKSVQVRVGNEGMDPAEGVQVFIVVDNKRLKLVGPEQIRSGESALFSGSEPVVLRDGQDLQVSLQCANCR